MVRQAAIIFGCLGVGELIVHFTGIQFPSSIIGLLLLTALLQIGWIKLEWVKPGADILTKNLAFFFIPPGVAVMLHFDLIRSSFWSIIIAAFGSTVLTLIVTGWAYQLLRKKGKKRIKHHSQ